MVEIGVPQPDRPIDRVVISMPQDPAIGNIDHLKVDPVVGSRREAVGGGIQRVGVGDFGTDLPGSPGQREPAPRVTLVVQIVGCRA